MRTITILTFIFFTNNIFSQNYFDYKKERNLFNLNLISKNQKILSYKKINDSEKLQGRYLGEVKTNQGTYYVVISSFIFNLKNSPTSENHIFIYTDKKQYFGYYYLSHINELPTTLKKCKLYFDNKNCKEKNIISLDNGFPKAINLKCNGENNYYELKK
ncbi:hypothetical protein [Flavobacterium nitrogenifigens]|uniref:Uncharacterized protein n=1 Tax=Flavobacterium nitrogenifigens TaxID=1617283 RepID=A0A521EH82_9FLAO|nr:hypothetical protein [Flavobacterium nitrogenifigens]KAF2326082.1 hypothetical protein DM397_22800 [Flavobacterium nitrogenifigens]SMO83265.1 hypothetical protein SAMN06265220_104298 [Flavobacterium nitrogenifigens]